MGRIGSQPGSSRAKGKGTLDNFISTVGAGGIARPNRYRVFFKGKGPVKAAQYVQMRVAPTLKAQYNTFSVEHSPEAQLFGPYDDDMGHDEDLIYRKKTQKSLAGGEAAGGMTSGSGSNFMRNLSMYCESIQMPGQNIRSVEDPLRFGPQREQAQGVTYGSVNARFICSRDLREKLFFEAWQSLIFNHDTWEMKFYKDYIGGLKIYQEDRSNNSTYGVELMEVFPKVVQQQELGWNINDAYQTISVELMFHSWEIADADPAGPMGGMTSPTAPNVVEGEVDATG